MATKKTKTRRAVKPKVEWTEQTAEQITDVMKSILSTNIQTIDRQEEGKTISIDQLPNCLLKHFFCSVVRDAKEAKVCVIAFAHKDGSWVALLGYPDKLDLKPREQIEAMMSMDILELQWRCDMIRDREAVLMAGEKLKQETAEELFPDWKGKRYHNE